MSATGFWILIGQKDKFIIAQYYCTACPHGI